MSNHLHLFKTFSDNLRKTFQKFNLTLNANGSVISEELYLCPISMVGFMKDSLQNGRLTIEHVPPESLGGKPLVLTSKEVNSKDGHTSDKKLLNFFESENFKVSKGVIDAKISSDDHDFKGVTAKFTVSLNNGKTYPPYELHI